MPSKQQFVIGYTQQKSGVSARGQRGLQLVPRGFKLPFGTLVIKSIHPRVLDEDVEAVHKGLRRSRTCSLRCTGARDNCPLNLLVCTTQVKTKR